jgi:lysophospholipase L1-like esterase
MLMLECMILGDSIATGIAKFRPECVSYAKVGINSYDFNHLHRARIFEAEAVIISLGSNDHKKIYTRRELVALREKVGGRRIYWILPANNVEIQEDIRQIAAEYKDIVLPIPLLSKDKVHPTMDGYKQLAVSAK